LIDEAISVPVPYGLSDIDLAAYHPRGESIRLPDGSVVGPRLIVEAKDEHDFDPSGRDFGKWLRSDVQKLAEARSIPRRVREVKFSMLRQEHFERASMLFGTDDFDRVFVLHALDQQTRGELAPVLTQRRVYIVTLREVMRDLMEWYVMHERPAGLRQTLVGDLIHLIVGFCGLRLPEQVK
jgi:hypothetical protein